MFILNIYIDGNNLYRGAKDLGYKINYKNFKSWLRQKYSPNKIYLFIGFIPDNIKFYAYLEECGFILIFKQTVLVQGAVKGNCDTELVLNLISDFYTNQFTKCILITGDGDFGCAISFLKDKVALHCIIAPDKNKCSILIRNKNIKILFLNDVYFKFSNLIRPK